jgi:eukaryotic-like serine/threonine-protein kinase
VTDLGAGAVIAGKYRLDYPIGRGGMGAVWAARHLQLDTQVALKFIDPLAETGDARLRFEREAKAAAQLRSPHVVQILDHGVDGDRPYIAMELLEGEDLGERLRKEKRLSVQAAAHIFSQAAKALRRAHDAGVIHRDLKPSNIFLARFDDDEVVKLLDFGVAKIRDPAGDVASAFTQTGVIFGSPAYMSPEQARGARVIDHRSDLWSLAVILFRAITGVKPFEAASIGDLVIKLCIDPIPVASKIAPDLSPEIDQFFERAFARDPEQRFPSAVAMAAEFEALTREGPEPSAPRASMSGVPQALLPNPAIKLYTLPEPKAPPRRPSFALPAQLPEASGAPRRSSVPNLDLPPPPESFSTPTLAARPPAATAMNSSYLMQTVPIPSEPSASGVFVPSNATIPFPSSPPSSQPADSQSAYPSSIPSQPSSMTPSPSMRTVIASVSVPYHQMRLILWGSIGGIVILLLIVISAASRGPGSDAPEVEQGGAPSPGPDVTSSAGKASVAPREGVAPAPSTSSSAAASSTSSPAETSAAPPATASASASASSRATPRGPAGKAVKGHVPNFGY